MARSKLGSASDGLVGHAAVYILAAALNAAIPFLLLPIIARWLGPADFGVVGSFVAFVNVLILLVGLNAYGFVSVGYYRDGAETLPHLVGAALTIISGASALIGATIWIGAAQVEQITGIDRAWSWTLPAAATGQAIVALGLAVAQTIRRPIVYATVQIGYGLSLALLALLLIGVLGMDWQGRALAQVLAASAAAGGTVIWLMATKRVTLTAGRDTVSRALAFGVPLLPHSFAAVAMGSMDRLALTGSSSPAVVGHYFLALQIASVFTAFAAAANQAWLPWLYARLASNDSTGWDEITQAIRIGGVLLLGGAIAMATMASLLVSVVGGPGFDPAIGPLRILSFYAACQAWYTLMSSFLFYAKRPKLLSVLTVSLAFLQAVLILFFLRWGAFGVATALAATAAIGAMTMSLVVYRYAINHRAIGPSAETVV